MIKLGEHPLSRMDIGKPKVLIAAPLGGHKQYSINAWFEWIVNQDYKNYDVCVCVNGENYLDLQEKINQTQLIDKHGNTKKIIDLSLTNSNDLSVIQKITYAREKIRRYAVEHKYDYILFLDTDTIPVIYDAIDLMIEKEKDVISGLYFYKGTKQPVIIDLKTNTNISLNDCISSGTKQEVIEVWGFGFGCLLLSNKVFSKCEFDYDLFGEERTDDFGYCHVMAENGFKRWFLPSIFCRHLEDQEPREEIALSNKFVLPVLTPENIKPSESSLLHDGENKSRIKNKIEGVD